MKKVKKSKRTHLKALACLGVSCLLWAAPASALVQDITAVFRPDASKPDENTFTNTTPVTGYCQMAPGQCADNKTFSIRLPVSAQSSGPLMAKPADPRQGAYWKAPAQWRSVTVVNMFGEEETVELRISGIGSRHQFDRHVAELVGGGVSALQGHQRLWVGSSWVNPPSPCRYSGVGFYGDFTYQFLWKTPVEEGCAKIPNYPIPDMRYEYLDIAYELRTPNPLTMSTGVYSGVLNFGIGPHQDFDFGDVMLPNDSQLMLSFTLDVQHILKVDLPPGGERVELLPQGGWQAWLQHGRPPARLLRDQTVRLTASSRFKMLLECSVIAGNTCGLKNGAGEQVPVQVAVTLPSGLSDGAGQSVNKRPLRLDGSGTELFQPSSYVDNRPAVLHFEVAKDDVGTMLSHPGSTYSGGVTVVWDSEV
ncbi:hypothetical protein [Pseudomonas poae]|uniref:Rhodanese domain-containing protein n=1 Tax=Pseudomonas poae TaxID=200451 RepID=A0A2S9EVF5_9PSED|nr:hypothetical protein [Pseudomonas poae]PRA29208.1 hypothetical protein CQZ97_12830 [Pseudomonas poae]PRC20151.1 hypothetical protein CQZ99_09210 [Pseudomonas poae]